MTDVQQGWYADPAGGPGQRWWDGAQWTGATRPMPVEVPGYAGAQPQGFNPPAYGQPGYQPQSYGQVPYSGTTSGQTGTLFQRNRYSAITVGVACVYVLLAFTANIVFIGILPIVFTVRAFRNGEKLAPVAAVVAALAVVVSLAAFAPRRVTRRGSSRRSG